MYGTDSKYYFWMEFIAAEDWFGASGSQPSFLMLFQMGDSQSEWTGVTITLSDSISPKTLTPISCKQSDKTSGADTVLTNGGDDSTFEGILTDNSGTTSV